jgi:TPR repeat protein
MRVYTWLLLLLLAPPLAVADFERGLAAYERGNYDIAMQELMQLAEAGDADAQFVLGRMFARGAGVIQDFVEAYKWYNLAAAGGQRLAPSAREVLGERMSPEQLATAQARSRDWQPLRRDQSPTPSASPSPDEEETSESTIALIQLELKRLGYPIEQINGQPGGQTRAAIRAFQADNGLSVDGRPSSALLEQLVGAQRGRPPIRRTPEGEDPNTGSFRRLM